MTPSCVVRLGHRVRRRAPRPAARSPRGPAARARRANSKSRWSCAGTPITAPVPYSISTYGATKHGMRSPFTGFTALHAQRQPLARGRLVVGAVGFRCSWSRNSFDVGRRCRPRSASVVTSACSGAKTKNVTPHSVSGRVVKTVTSSPVSSIAERDLGALGAPDPVPLHGSARGRASLLQLRHVVQQAVGVVGDLEEPLGQVAPHDQRVAALAPRRAMTCSFARTVWSFGHQFAGASFR